MVVAAALVLSLAHAGVLLAAEPEAQKIELKDGSTLYVHPDGTGRMVDAHGAIKESE